ncbi:hypothetical protein FC093_21990 [Ilyomonas limi]|uniref:Uncharacterized protein n=1 Tax=Ilyomonas limi TaxID=2575867 RepID=A0A4U3KR62_9BACT|nr:hypothetical protein [Ilyomonas limi]TKK64722.1 hypothetical protein FC093_21990 [Ilyomonas limi]
MPANFSSLTKKGDEPINIENDSLRILMLLQKELMYEYRKKMQDESNRTSLQSQKRILQVSVVSIIITLLIMCYILWKDQSTSAADYLFDNTVVMKDFILNQMVQAQ